MMLTDGHAHSSAISGCCRISGKDGIDVAKMAGLDGFVLTNHYHEGYIGGEKFPTLELFAEKYVEEYRALKEYGDSVGFKVFFGVELTSGWDSSVHLLIYGVDETFVLENPNLFRYSLEELYSLVHDAGGILIQAHPYRMTPRLQDLKFLDGVEISCHPHAHYLGPFVEEMKEIAEKNGKILTCGGDYHADVAYRPQCGIYVPEGVTDGKQFADYLSAESSTVLRVHLPYGEVFDLPYTRNIGNKGN